MAEKMKTSPTISKKYQPLEIFVKKQLKKTEENTNEEDIRRSWFTLSDDKKLKFIKKAENKFDEDHESIDITHENRFSINLTSKELDILLKSYNFPEKLADNYRSYYVSKQQGNSINGDFEKLDEIEKDKLHDEYLTAKEEYYKSYAAFLNELPKDRYVDYRYYVKLTKKTDSKSRKERINKMLHPHDFYYEKYKEKFLQENKGSSLVAYTNARSEYKKLDDKKKIKFIKKSESAYDEVENQNKLFSQIISKDDLQLLFESYGMPKCSINKNFYNFYMKFAFSKFDGDFSQRSTAASDAYKMLSQSERMELTKKHQEAMDDYEKQMKEFLENLPKNRAEDYKRFQDKKNRKPTAGLSANKSRNISCLGDTTKEETALDDEGSNLDDTLNGNSPKKQRIM